MGRTSKRARTEKSPKIPAEQKQNEESLDGEIEGSSTYEQFRDQRIRENMERMEKLGIIDLSIKLKSEIVASKRSSSRNISDKKPEKLTPLTPSDPPRRSSRLKSVTPVSYAEYRGYQKKETFKNEEICIPEGSKPEIYTEEHDKLLGDCKTTWTLLVDGYDNNGKRIYDPVKGETCHQCRQKTLGHHTHCSKCNIVQGQFCGDCLYMSTSARHCSQKPIGDPQRPPNLRISYDVCRDERTTLSNLPRHIGSKNCKKIVEDMGRMLWKPTKIPDGYALCVEIFATAVCAERQKVLKRGFKSVAHYLIQTCRSQPTSEDQETKNLNSVNELPPVALNGSASLCDLAFGEDEEPDGSPKPPINHSKDDDLEEEQGEGVQISRDNNKNVSEFSKPRSNKKNGHLMKEEEVYELENNHAVINNLDDHAIDNDDKFQKAQEENGTKDRDESNLENNSKLYIKSAVTAQLPQNMLLKN